MNITKEHSKEIIIKKNEENKNDLFLIFSTLAAIILYIVNKYFGKIFKK